MRARLFTAVLLSALPALIMSAPGAAEAKGCIRLVRSGGQEMLVNTCTSCKVVQVTRERRNTLGPPNLRSFKVFKNGKYILPFKGPGRTRVGVEEPCSSPSRQSIDPNEQLVDGSDTMLCVRAVSVKGRGVMLANKCNTCRAVVVERTKSGQSPTREAMTLPGRSVTPFNARGYSGGRLLKEGGCR